MKTWQELLREHDPGTERMDPETVARIRETVVRAARVGPPPARIWPMRVALAGFACLVLVLSILAAQRPVTVMSVDSPAVAGGERRQIRFATPGGTRIIWEINPNFTWGDTLP